MYKKIMVPLDGSTLAECVLPHLETIVKGCDNPTIVFVRVAEPAQGPLGAITDGATVFSEKEASELRKKMDQSTQAEAEKYLASLMKGKYGDAKPSSAVLVGRAAETLADYANKNGVDLVVISTHGRSGVSRWVMGSTAERILRSTCVPVMMVRAPGCVPAI